MNILVTGGAGYIGSHVVVELIDSGHFVVINDVSKNAQTVAERIKLITGTKPELHAFDLADKYKLEDVFATYKFDAVMHFAGLKAVGESVEKPLNYYRTNLDTTLSLLETMEAFDVRNLVFSSSATVYGSAPIPYSEDSQTGQGITNPYGQTKYFIEQILRDTARANAKNRFTILRYFNPIGAHESGLIGEQVDGIPNNLMPYIVQVANGKTDELKIFGDDFDTPDGTGVRDYIHVTDVAKGHIAALATSSSGVAIYNLGTGKGTSVLELIHAFEKVSGKTIPYKVTARRAGDLAMFYAVADKATKELGWKTEKSIEKACEDSWHWQSENPNGYIDSLI